MYARDDAAAVTYLNYQRRRIIYCESAGVVMLRLFAISFNGRRRMTDRDLG